MSNNVIGRPVSGGPVTGIPVDEPKPTTPHHPGGIIKDPKAPTDPKDHPVSIFKPTITSF